MEFKVPKHTLYVAADDDGEVHAYGKGDVFRHEEGQYKGDYLGFVGELPRPISPRKYQAVKVERITVVTPLTNI